MGILLGYWMFVLCLSILMNIVISGLVDKIIWVWKRNNNGYYFCVFVMVGYIGFVKFFCVMLDVEWGVLVYSGSLDGDICVWWVLEDDFDSFFLDEINVLDSFLVVNWRVLMLNV